MTMLVRGVLRRCPWCGDRRAYFTGWFSKDDACHACGLAWRRDDVGFELGAVVIATIVTFTAIIAAVAIGLVITAPEFATVGVIAVALAIAVVVPIVIYPISYTVWQAVDLIMRPETRGADGPAEPRYRPSASGPDRSDAATGDQGP